MRRSQIFAAVLVIALIAFTLWQLQADTSELQDLIERHKLLGAVIYVAFLAGSVVLLPLSSLPLIPVAAAIYGTVVTAFLSILGWWIGAVIAFLVARAGRPYLERVVSLEKVDYLERSINPQIGFFGIVLLRMILPVDIVSFALGLLKHLTFSTYAIATLIGIIPFAFVWSSAGESIAEGNILSGFLLLALLALAVFILKLMKKKDVPPGKE